jgi:hypothetical protein
MLVVATAAKGVEKGRVAFSKGDTVGLRRTVVDEVGRRVHRGDVLVIGEVEGFCEKLTGVFLRDDKALGSSQVENPGVGC